MTIFQRTGRRERLYIGANPHRMAGERVPIAGLDAARALLADLGQDAWGMAALRRLAAEARGPAPLCWTSDHAILEDLAQRLAARSLTARAVPLAPPEIPETPEVARARPPPPPPAAKPAKETTWFEVEVLWADGSGPVPKIKLKIKAPGGGEGEHTTNAEGLIRLDGVQPGDCEIKSVPAGATRAEAILVSGGSAPPKTDAPPPKKKKKGAAPAYKVVVVEPYKVKTGDTLGALAEAAGTTWKELAKFNWGTDDPQQINKHLRWDVGCTKRSKDGKSFVFDDSDDPGIVLLPRPWEAKGSTGQRLTLLASKIAKAKPWIFSL